MSFIQKCNLISSNSREKKKLYINEVKVVIDNSRVDKHLLDPTLNLSGIELKKKLESID